MFEDEGSPSYKEYTPLRYPPEIVTKMPAFVVCFATATAAPYVVLPLLFKDEINFSATDVIEPPVI